MLEARCARRGRARGTVVDAAHLGPESIRVSRRRQRVSRPPSRVVRAPECRPERPSGLVSHAPGRGRALEPAMAAPNPAAKKAPAASAEPAVPSLEPLLGPLSGGGILDDLLAGDPLLTGDPTASSGSVVRRTRPAS